jgi:hypothetical protein
MGTAGLSNAQYYLKTPIWTSFCPSFDRLTRLDKGKKPFNMRFFRYNHPDGQKEPDQWTRSAGQMV